ncbi:MAG: hypothetical protein H6712_08545 [Myxococcales bacterium]|nr:hypothetical protein [Myxococcales bacterium]MCB9713888.1 hypothetical protein [Myxococcales bacterium]
MVYRPWSPPLVCCSLLLLCLGCPGDDGSGEEGNGSTGATSATGSSTSDGTGSSTSAADGSSTAGEGGGTTGSTVVCGENTCAAQEYCEWNANSCGTQDFDEGSCAARPEGCTADENPVCGCDGQVYSNECVANEAGVDVDADGECEAPEGYFRCGYRFCDPQVAYCQLSASDVGGEPDGYTCVQPTECSPIECGCLDAEPCFAFGCETTEDGGVLIVCPGG